MNLLFYIITASLIGIVGGMLLPRLAMIVGSLCILLFLLTIAYAAIESLVSRPHESATGMLMVLEFFTILPLGIVLVMIGAKRNR
jgi:hypothetical protein